MDSAETAAPAPDGPDDPNRPCSSPIDSHFSHTPTDAGSTVHSPRPAALPHAEHGFPAGPLEPGPAASSYPIQKRRRVTRACDECRRKKIKCDGKQPCPHCLVYSYECTYDKPSNRRRNPPPQYINVIERKLRRAELLLHLVQPEIDLDNPLLDECIEEGVDSLDSLLRKLSLKSSFSPASTPVTGYGPAKPLARTGSAPAGPAGPAGQPDSESLESMVKTTGQLDVGEDGHVDYYGGASGYMFARKMKEKLNRIIGTTEAIPNLKSLNLPDPYRSSSLDSPLDSSHVDMELPPPDVARYLCDLAINDASLLMRVIHLPSFNASLDRLYSRSPSQYSNTDHSFLPVFYSLLALGSLYSREENSDLDSKGYSVAFGNGFKHYKESTRLFEVTDCRDIHSLQAVVYLVLFLQSSARLSTCYSFVGCAMRAALRMGLHRKLENVFNPVETEVRKRVFWALRRMDIHISTILGLPYLLNDDDIDQDFPSILDDEYITPEGLLTPPSDHITVMAAADAHIKLLGPLMKAVKHIYPTRPLENGGSFLISAKIIRELEVDMRKWKEDLPVYLHPGGDYPIHIIRAQQQLRISYAHIQMMVYRPFLHYISHQDQPLTPNKFSFEYAATCVSVSRNIVHITTEMNGQHLLIGAYWFVMYTAFFAVLSLVFFVLESPEDESVHNALADAYEGKNTLAQLAKRSCAADRCTNILRALFSRLPAALLKRHHERGYARKSQPGKRSYRAAAAATTGSEDGDENSGDDRTVRMGEFGLYPCDLDGIDQLATMSGPTTSAALPGSSSLDRMDDLPGNSTDISLLTSYYNGGENAVRPASASRSAIACSGLIFPDGDPFAYPQHEPDRLRDRSYLSDFVAAGANADWAGATAALTRPDLILGVNGSVNGNSTNPDSGSTDLFFSGAPFLDPASAAPLFSMDGPAGDEAAGATTSFFSSELEQELNAAAAATARSADDDPQQQSQQRQQQQQPGTRTPADDHVPLPNPMPSYILGPNTLFDRTGVASIGSPAAGSGGSTTPSNGFRIGSGTFNGSVNGNGAGLHARTPPSALAGGAAGPRFPFVSPSGLFSAGQGPAPATAPAPSSRFGQGMDGPTQAQLQQFLMQQQQHQQQQQQQQQQQGLLAQQHAGLPISDPGMLLQLKMLRSLQFDPGAYSNSTGTLFALQQALQTLQAQQAEQAQQGSQSQQQQQQQQQQ